MATRKDKEEMMNSILDHASNAINSASKFHLDSVLYKEELRKSAKGIMRLHAKYHKLRDLLSQPPFTQAMEEYRRAKKMAREIEELTNV